MKKSVPHNNLNNRMGLPRRRSKQSKRGEPIDKIRKRFKNEWLLIAIDKMDKVRTVPLTGRLIAHSPLRNVIYDHMVKAKGLVMPIFSDKTLPHGYAVAF